jgi:branched-subunit amino acid transport protein
MDLQDVEPWLVVIASAAATFSWRGLGATLAGQIRVDSELFNWVACVAYAMVAGLIARIVFMPTGLLATSLLADRLIACVLALAAFYLSRRNLFVAVMTGVAVVLLAGYARQLPGFG